MKVGTCFDATVRDLTSEGQGVVSAPNGMTVFAAGVWLGEEATFKLKAVKGRVGFAELVEILSPSRFRRPSACAFQGVNRTQCGGCPWMFVTYEAQLAAKQARIETQLERFVRGAQIQPILAAENEFEYRNRMQLKTNGEKLGFVAAKTNDLVAVNDCIVLSEVNRFTLRKLVSELPVKAWRSPRKNQWTTLDIDESTTASQVSVNRRLPFQQANSAQNSRMKVWLHNKLLQFESYGEALELFCGSGNFTEVLAGFPFDKILAVEAQTESVKSLQSRGLPGVHAQHGDLYSEATLLAILKTCKSTRTLILDPPRDGFKTRKALLGTLKNLEDVFYVSCNLATFRRDLEDFVQSGFEVVEIQPLDQFPQTPHVEILSHLKRPK